MKQVIIEGLNLEAIPYNGEDNMGSGIPVKQRKCHDCGVKWGKYHKPGCDMERCPKCGGQLISCDCLPNEE